MQSLIFLVLLIAIFYFMLIRPQKKRVEQHANLLSSIGVGDEVVTIGGMHGTVRSIGDEDVEIEPAPGVTMRFVKNAIARRVTEELDEEETTATDDTTTTEESEPAALETSEDEKS